MTAYPRLTAAFPNGFTASRLARLTCGAALACALFLLPGQALAINDDAVLRRMDAVLEENARLRDEAWKARKHGRDAAKQAEDALDASEDRVEKTRAEALAHVAGVSPAQVEGLRKEGKSWGQAAGELGVHPGFLGVGKTPLYESLPKRKAVAKASKAKRGKQTEAAAPAKGKGKAPAVKKAPAKGKTATKAPAKTKAKTSKKTKKAAKKG